MSRPSTRNRPTTRFLFPAIALTLLAASCGGTADSATDGSATAGGTSTATAVPTTTTDDTITAATKPTTEDRGRGVARLGEPIIDSPEELAFIAQDGPEPTAVPSTVAPETDQDEQSSGQDGGGGGTTATTSGGGSGPVTTSGGGGGGDTSIYQGVLGRIGPDQLITPPLAPAPTVAAGVLPLTGLAGDVPNRPAAVVKIDNSSRARPQSGLNAADIVIEEEVEGGITRLAAIFHSTSTVVGPVRSGRTTDIGVLGGLGSPLLLYSGANSVTDSLLRAQTHVQNRSASSSSGYWRNGSRRSPSNLYSDTGPHWASAAGGPPPPQFAYRSGGPSTIGTEDTSLSVSYRASKAAWTWDGTAWLRTQGGSAHMTANGQQVSAANVVVIEAREVPSGMVDSSGANVPEFVFVGNGRATVFTSGKRIEGTWTRSTLRSVATLTTADGAVIELTPGRTWIELIGEGSGILG